MKAVVSHIRHSALTALLLLPLLAMSAVPQGTMAVQGAQGMEVVLCTGSGPQTILLDENGVPVEETQDAPDCGWWMAGQSLCLTKAPEVALPQSLVCETISGWATHVAALSRGASPNPARGPPLV